MMLVLQRRAGEKIVLTVDGVLVTLVVVEIDRALGKVRLGFEAPRSIPIQRAERRQAKQGEA